MPFSGSWMLARNWRESGLDLSSLTLVNDFSSSGSNIACIIEWRRISGLLKIFPTFCPLVSVSAASKTGILSPSLVAIVATMS